MPDLAADMVEPLGGFPIQDMMMRYNVFMPRLYNWCISLGFEPGKIMPSRAFCADESQGYPIIMLAKHFGTLPFNHGRVAGIVSAARHGPHAEHGQDLLIIQASHVGYDPQLESFGIYRRLQTSSQVCGPNCGVVHNVLSWYQNEYRFAQHSIQAHKSAGRHYVIIDNQLLRDDRDEGLFLHLDKLIETKQSDERNPIKQLSTSKAFTASNALVARLGDAVFEGEKPQPIGSLLTPDMFYFRRNIPKTAEGAHYLEHNLIRFMPQIITDPAPMLTAAEINTQIEFDRTFRTIVKERAYHGKKLLFIAGINIDVSPQPGQLFPLTKFVPWAAYIQDRDGSFYTLEQNEVVQALLNQSSDNPDQIDLEASIRIMADADEINVKV